jgi:hypothetical protein
MVGIEKLKEGITIYDIVKNPVTFLPVSPGGHLIQVYRVLYMTILRINYV